ncbi:CBO0543 family protein [Brevibacillus brevis]|uniref:CBO0543 family protein n=1 Tax=Brevibacillus brevis TaxID=1393 RepID=A0ABY9T8W4_BREBE|nr:CBO0543 family protein [Brevibacillus brevis]WNC16322.1 CBO0543 family protein [Brevibacillus brevis]
MSEDFQHIIQRQYELRDSELAHWIRDDLFSFPWWVGVSSVILLWIWFKVVDRSRFVEITLMGSLTGLFSTLLDVTGCSFVLWSYPDSVEPIFPPMFPANLVVLPSVYMVVYQIFYSWKSYMIASMGLSLFLSFVGEPLVVLLGSYQPTNWEYLYSVPAYFLLAIGVKAITHKIVRYQSSS